MPVAKGPGGLYQASIVSEPCEGGFKATVLRVVLLTTRSPVGIAVGHDAFPHHFAESKQKAERMAEAYFKAWAKIQNLRL